MKIIQLFKDGKELIASDGIMKVDGRLNNESIHYEIVKRNNRFAVNFPHYIADQYAIYSNRIGSKLSNIYNV